LRHYQACRFQSKVHNKFLTTNISLMLGVGLSLSVASAQTDTLLMAQVQAVLHEQEKGGAVALFAISEIDSLRLDG